MGDSFHKHSVILFSPSVALWVNEEQIAFYKTFNTKVSPASPSSFLNESFSNNKQILYTKETLKQNSVSHSSSVFADVRSLWPHCYQLPSMSDRRWRGGLGHTPGSLMLGLN